MQMNFDPRTFHVKSVADKVALRQVSLPVLWFSPDSTIPPMPSTQLHLNTALNRMTNVRNARTFKQCSALLDIRRH